MSWMSNEEIVAKFVIHWEEIKDLKRTLEDLQDKVDTIYNQFETYSTRVSPEDVIEDLKSRVSYLEAVLGEYDD